MLDPQTLLNNRYRIESLLGEGGMGAVYRAHDETLDVTVAVKENQVVTAAAQRQFEREARLLAGLRHPNLPRVTDHFFIHGQGQYLVMDFVEGEDLSKRLARLGRLPEAQVLPWALEILDALAYLHLREIIHRDLKPANIKIGANGRATLVDFGIAKVAGAGQTTTGARGLTPGYAPPEQYGFGSTDPRSDLYSFGATLYHALTGRIPVDAFERLMQHTPLQPVRDLAPEVSPRTAKAVEKSLALKASERWPTAVDMQRGLEPDTKPGAGRAAALPTLQLPEYQATIAEAPPAPPAPVSAPAPAGTGPRPVTAPRPTSRVWIGVGLAGLLGLGALGLLVAVAALVFRSRLLPGSLVQPAAPGPGQIVFALDNGDNRDIYRINPDGSGLENLTEHPAQDYNPAVSPDGSRIAFVSDRDGNEEIYVMNADGSDLVNLTNHPADDFLPAWSPDGGTLAFVSDRDGNAEIYTLAESGLVRFTNHPGADLWPSFSRTGEFLAFASDRDGDFEVYVILSDGLHQYTNNDAYDAAPRWSPASDALAFESDRDGNLEIYLFAADGVQRYTNAPASADRLPAWSPDGSRLVFVSDREGRDQIYVLGPDGVVRVSSGAGEATDPSWGP